MSVTAFQINYGTAVTKHRQFNKENILIPVSLLLSFCPWNSMHFSPTRRIQGWQGSLSRGVLWIRPTGNKLPDGGPVKWDRSDKVDNLLEGCEPQMWKLWFFIAQRLESWVYIGENLITWDFYWRFCTPRQLVTAVGYFLRKFKGPPRNWKISPIRKPAFPHWRCIPSPGATPFPRKACCTRARFTLKSKL